ncbi:hypothetical protein LEMLEM_LOCUS9324 [Lemmus lemmus]
MTRTRRLISTLVPVGITSPSPRKIWRMEKTWQRVLAALSL